VLHIPGTNKNLENKKIARSDIKEIGVKLVIKKS
jgi:hypothetical protein